MGVEFQVTVTPVQAPQFDGFGVAQTCYRETSVLALSVPGWAFFNDGDAPFCDVSFNLELISQVFGYAGIAPTADANKIELRDSHSLNATATPCWLGGLLWCGNGGAVFERERDSTGRRDGGAVDEDVP